MSIIIIIAFISGISYNTFSRQSEFEQCGNRYALLVARSTSSIYDLRMMTGSSSSLAFSGSNGPVGPVGPMGLKRSLGGAEATEPNSSEAAAQQRNSFPKKQKFQKQLQRFEERVTITCCCLREPVCVYRSEDKFKCRECVRQTGFHLGTCRKWECVVERSSEAVNEVLQPEHVVPCSKEQTYWIVVLLVLLVLFIKFLAFTMCLSGQMRSSGSVRRNCANVLRSLFLCYPCRRLKTQLKSRSGSKTSQLNSRNHSIDHQLQNQQQQQRHQRYEVDGRGNNFVEETDDSCSLAKNTCSLIEQASEAVGDTLSRRSCDNQSSPSMLEKMEFTRSLLSLRIDFPKLNLDEVDARDFEFLDGSRSLLASVRTMSNPNSARESYVEYEHKPGIKLRSTYE